MEEQWKRINGFNYYEISNLGRVRSYIVNESEPKLMKLAKNTRGYVAVHLRKDKNILPTHHRVHRLVVEHFVDNANMSLHVDHIDEDKSNNKLSNLRLCTTHENNTFFITGARSDNYSTNVAVTVNGETFQSIYAAAKYIFSNIDRDVKLETIRREVSAIANNKTKPRNMYGQFSVAPIE